MFLSDLQAKDVVSMFDGKNLGKIINVEINEDGQILNFVVAKKRFFWRFLFSNPEIKVALKNIDTIGEDVILVKNN